MSNGNGHRWSKFWWCDWQNDVALKRCSLAAHGLWMMMLCIAHEGEPCGYLRLNGQPLTAADLNDMIAKTTVKEVEKLLAELEAKGVFSRAADGAIYSRRMVKDAAATEAGREWGKAGGNPKLNGKDHAPKKPQGGLTPPLNLDANPLAYPPPLSEGVNGGPNPQKLEADLDLEAKKEDKKELINSSLSFPCSAREDREPPPAARLAVENVVARVTSALESSGKKPNGRAPKMSAIQQQIAIIRGPVLDDLDTPPDAWERPRRGPVDPIRSVAEQLAILRGEAA